ncbi:MAG: hypothetical protein MR413_03040 [Clostridia bacterium]|nr:hypothetical protein [Clostridia bacterium]
MYRSYSVNNMPTPMKYEQEEIAEPVKKMNVQTKKEEKESGLMDNIQTDDIILLAVVLVLLIDGCDDKLLLAALGFIFISEFL